MINSSLDVPEGVSDAVLVVGVVGVMVGIAVVVVIVLVCRTLPHSVGDMSQLCINMCPCYITWRKMNTNCFTLSNIISTRNTTSHTTYSH